MFVLFLVLVVGISTTVRTVLVEWIRSRSTPALEGDEPRAPRQVEGVQDALDQLLDRVGRLEEERDFYRDLLGSPEARRELPQPPRTERSDVEST